VRLPGAAAFAMLRLAPGYHLAPLIWPPATLSHRVLADCHRGGAGWEGGPSPGLRPPSPAGRGAPSGAAIYMGTQGTASLPGRDRSRTKQRHPLIWPPATLSHRVLADGHKGTGFRGQGAGANGKGAPHLACGHPLPQGEGSWRTAIGGRPSIWGRRGLHPYPEPENLPERGISTRGGMLGRLPTAQAATIMSGLQIEKYSLGVGDRFGHQAVAQLEALRAARSRGVEIVPVWNKSNREHNLIGSEPAAVRAAVEAAARETKWPLPYYVDADHIGLKTVDRFLAVCDFFTIDVADFIGQPSPQAEVDDFLAANRNLVGKVDVPGLERPIETSSTAAAEIAGKYLLAVREAGKVYRYIAEKKGEFITEVSLDETDRPQTPQELLFILAALAQEGVRVQTVAPKFTGRFNKGVDYAGDVAQFESEFNDDLCVVAWAVRNCGLPPNLKLSVHSGSDKFSIYPAIRRALRRHHAGLHLKTAGTTWLEEVIGLAETGGEGLAVAKEIYANALANREEYCRPYATVVDIDPARLPGAGAVSRWTGAQFARAVRHNPGDPEYNPHVRQLLHVGFKGAAQLGRRYLDQLEACADVIGRNVAGNLLKRHIRPLFLEP